MPLSARSDIVTLVPGELQVTVRVVRLYEYFQFATVALLVYDTIITLDKEAKYFWKLPRKPVDFIYFINRYIGIFGAVASLFFGSLAATLPLQLSLWTHGIADWITIISIDYILMIRVLALYSQDRTLSICPKTLLALEAASTLGVVLYMDIIWHPVFGIFADVPPCGRVISWQLAMVHWLTPLLYGTLLMILALYKSAQYWRMSGNFKGFTLVKVLIEDQIVYFLSVISCSVFAILAFRVMVSNLFLGAVLVQLGNPVLLSLLGSRILFNLKEAGERGQNEGTSYRTPSRTMSDMDFAEPVSPQREGGTGHSGSEQVA